MKKSKSKCEEQTNMRLADMFSASGKESLSQSDESFECEKIKLRQDDLKS